MPDNTLNTISGTQISALPDGIYFGLGNEEYHAQPRLSATGMTHMMESPSAWWAQSWLNPDREEKEPTDAMTIGSAYHCARLEPASFAERYACLPNPGDYDNLLTSVAAIKARLKDLGEPQTIVRETPREQAERLLAVDQDAQIWFLIMNDWAILFPDHIPVKTDVWEKIKRDARNIRLNPEIEALISGGAAEVSILWTCEATGVKLKCRTDYLTASHFTDLKTWDTKSFGKPGNQAVRDAFQFNGYYRGAWLYLEGVEEVRTGNLKIRSGAPSKDQRTIISEIRKREKPLDCWYLFQRKGGIPDIRARRIVLFGLPEAIVADPIVLGEIEVVPTARATGWRLSILAKKARREVLACKQAFIDGIELHGNEGEPWFPRDIIGTLEDNDFSSYFLDSIQEPR